MKKFDLAVLGGGVAGASAAYSAASKAKEEGKKFSVALISNEDAVYARSALLSIVAREAKSSKNITVYPTTELKKLGIKFYRRHQISSVDFENSILLVRNLENEELLKLSFENLVIATGSIPKVPPVEGVHLKGVHTVKWVKDAIELSKKVKRGTKALVFGAGLIGLETASVLHKRGLKVTVATRGNILSGILEMPLSNYIRKQAEKMGLTILTNSRLGKIGGKRKVEYAVVNDEKIALNIVLLCIGVTPNTEILASTGLAVAENGAIKTDRRMETNIKNVYAVGDCAEKFDFITRKPIYLPLGSLAARTAEIAGLNAFGIKTEFAGYIRHQYYHIFGKHIASMGLTCRDAASLGINAEAFPITPLREGSSYDWGLLKSVFTSKMCVVVEKNTGHIVGWQSIGAKDSVCRYDVLIDEIIRKKGKIKDLEEVGLMVC